MEIKNELNVECTSTYENIIEGNLSEYIKYLNLES